MTLRAKLMLLVGSAALAVLLGIGASFIIAAQQLSQIATVENRLVPKVELGPKLNSDFSRLRQGMQEAVAARDVKALDATATIRNALIDLVTAPDVLDARAADSLHAAVRQYDVAARDVSRRLIDGETGEQIVQDIEAMQKRQADVSRLIENATRLSRSELAAGFAAVRADNRRADRLRLVIGLAGLLVLVALSTWVSGGILSTVRNLTRGFSRFGKGDFTWTIPDSGRDELGGVARQANRMVGNLRKLQAQRDANDRLRSAQVQLSDLLLGDLGPGDVAARVLGFLARETDVRAGAFYAVDGEGLLRLQGEYARDGIPTRDGDGADVESTPTFRVGEGLVGEAARDDDLVVIDDVPDGYLRIHSGLGETQPAAVALVPLRIAERPIGVVELAFLRDCSDDMRELVETIRPMLASTLDRARSAARTRELLARTQEQAERLSAQEEELRQNNRELHAQQEELRRANEDLEAQRRGLREKNAELERARLGLQQKAEELAATSGYKSQFLANMSHELRTPLNSMLLLSHLLSENEEGNLTPQQVRHCQTIRSSGRDLLALINQVLDLAKIEAGKVDAELEVVPVRHFTSFVQRIFEPLAAEKRIRLDVQIAADVPDAVTTDPQLVERVLSNLLGNAVKFTEQGSVTLRIAREVAGGELLSGRANGSDALLITVADTGSGIPAEDQERIFEAFEQTRDGSGKHSGSGLGLAIARESARRLGGELRLESSSARGTTFEFYLPASGDLSSAPAPDRTPSSVVPVVDSLRLPPGGQRTLVVIEDDTVFAEQLADVIRAHGFEPVTARTGEEGLRCIREHRPLGVVLDIRLPDVDGWTVLERIRAKHGTACPVHVVSALDVEDRALLEGAVGYLRKPATHADLAGVVRRLTRADGDADRVLVVEDDPREGALVVDMLAQHGIEARHVTTAGGALSALGREPFGCMVLDLGLPDMDGFSLLETLRDDPVIRSPGVVVHTARDLTKQETRKLEAYAQAVILKSEESLDRLLDEVRGFLRRLEEALEEASDVERGSGATEASFEGVRILVVDDDMRTVYALSAVLSGRGAEVLVAETGKEALELLENGAAVEAVLMDVMMPEMDGYETMRRIRADLRFDQLPIVAVTARAMKGERERCIAAGASDYLTKPVDGDLLLQKLAMWLHAEGGDAA